ncbi:MAG: redoxin domain-containing protein [Actinobacteria bacterium]|nr:redoxin domain-containing protein [Actinomycetota bacterium]
MTSGKKPRLPVVSPPSKKAGGRKVTRAMIVVYVLLIGGLFVALALRPSSTGGGGATAGGYTVGTPGPGVKAPNFSLPSTAGGTVQLSDYRGKSVLLFFHEGLGCQPCWDNIRDLENAKSKMKSAGIDKLVTITSNPLNLIAQKMNDEKLTSVALADSDLKISNIYQTSKYGMAGHLSNGHSFVLVGPTGLIEWRADYGGAPNYTMYVPVDKILSDLKAGRKGA